MGFNLFKMKKAFVLLLAFAAFSIDKADSFSSKLCPGGCECDDGNAANVTVTCGEDANLKAFPQTLNPRMLHLSITDNKIKRLEGFLMMYAELKTVDLSRNEITHLAKYQFVTSERLQSFNISRNFILSLKAKTFQGAKKLNTIDLSENAVDSLVNGTFLGLISLIELRLNGNEITAIEADAFKGLSSLRTLYLDGNKLETLESRWLEPLQSLRFIYASDNKIKTLQADTFKPLTALKVITMSHNDLEENGIHPSAFRGCRSVDTIDMSHNKLTEVPADALSQLVQLHELDLSGNPMKTLHSKSFKNMHVLWVLKLNRMSSLTRIEGGTFRDNLKLQELWLEDNENLEPLPWGSFATNGMIETLSYRNNPWPTLSPLQIPMQSLRNLYIGGLPLNCNCSIVWLWELYKHESSSFYIEPVRCEEVAVEAGHGLDPPGGQAGDFLSEMNVDQLICPDVTRFVLAVSIAIIVTVLVLVCASLAVYKFRRWRFERRYMKDHPQNEYAIKDDTMVYKSALPGGAGEYYYSGLNGGLLDQSSSTSTSIRNNSGNTYQAISPGGFSPVKSSSNQNPPENPGPVNWSNGGSENPGPVMMIIENPSNNLIEQAEESVYENPKYSEVFDVDKTKKAKKSWDSEELSDEFSYHKTTSSSPSQQTPTSQQFANKRAQNHGSPQSTSTGLSSSYSTASTSNGEERSSISSHNSSNTMGFRPIFFSPQLQGGTTAAQRFHNRRAMLANSSHNNPNNMVGFNSSMADVHNVYEDEPHHPHQSGYVISSSQNHHPAFPTHHRQQQQHPRGLFSGGPSGYANNTLSSRLPSASNRGLSVGTSPLSYFDSLARTVTNTGNNNPPNNGDQNQKRNNFRQSRFI